MSKNYVQQCPGVLRPSFVIAAQAPLSTMHAEQWGLRHQATCEHGQTKRRDQATLAGLVLHGMCNEQSGWLLGTKARDIAAPCHCNNNVRL